MKRLMAMISLGRDASKYFPDVVKQVIIHTHTYFPDVVKQVIIYTP
jgi:hypothetical protein